MAPRRALVVAAVASLVLSACGAAASGPAEEGAALDVVPSPDASTTVSGGLAEGPREDVPSALDDPMADGLPEPSIDPSRVRSGGPPPDGIPPIDVPAFDVAADVTWLDEVEPVLALTIGEDQRAYPVQIMVWHEIVNDVVGGAPVAVTYCPLCNSALAFDRRLTGPDGLDRVVSFGTSGRLYNSDLLMYDRQTESLWSQLIGTAVAGHLTGVELERYPVQTVPFGDWRDQHPDGLVLNTDTGEQRPYGANPYEGYDAETSTPFLFDGAVDDRLPPKRRVVGIATPDQTQAVAVDHALLARDGVVELTLDGVDLVAAMLPGAASPLDEAATADGQTVGATVVVEPVVEGERLTLAVIDGELVDRETGSTWSVGGTGLSGPLAGAQLDVVPHSDPFWFAWAAFYPATELVTE